MILRQFLDLLNGDDDDGVGGCWWDGIFLTPEHYLCE